MSQEPTPFRAGHRGNKDRVRRLVSFTQDEEAARRILAHQTAALRKRQRGWKVRAFFTSLTISIPIGIFGSLVGRGLTEADYALVAGSLTGGLLLLVHFWLSSSNYRL